MRRQLLLLVGATTLLVLAAFLVPLALLVRSQAEDQALTEATLEAQSLAAVVGAADPDGVRVTLDQINAGGDRNVTVFMPDGTVLGNDAPRDDAIRLAGTGRAFMAERDGGARSVLVPVQGLPGGTAVVQSSVSEAVLHEGVARAWLVMTALGAGLFVLGLGMAALLARHLVRSVGQVATVADRLAGGDLTARVTPDGPPEVQRVGAGLNHLAGRVGELLAAQREEVADISHRLRTPVTALRLNADSLRDPDEASRIGADVDALERMVDEVIREARRPTRTGTAGDLAAQARSRSAFWSALSDEQGRAFAVQVPAEPVLVGVHDDEVLAVIDALLGNVFAHTPEGTDLSIEVHRAPDGGGVLVVADSGPGFPAGYIGTRGYSGAGSTGLGLDIVRRTAEASGGHMVIGAAEPGGARVRVEFGPPRD